MVKKIDFIWSETLHEERWLERWRNSYLFPAGLWKWVIRQDDYDEVLGIAPKGLARYRRQLQRLLRKVLWFWPQVIDSAYWASGDPDAAGTPVNYSNATEDVLMLAAEVAARSSAPDAPILDLGCNCGRCLSSVAALGQTNLFGVDINPAAIREMFNIFPNLSGITQARRDFFQRYLDQSADQSFDIVMTRGATVELVHPSYPLVREICRVCSGHVVLMIRENGFAYPRLWVEEFERNDFMLVKKLRPVHQELQAPPGETGEGTSLLVFRRRPSRYVASLG